MEDEREEEERARWALISQLRAQPAERASHTHTHTHTARESASFRGSPNGPVSEGHRHRASCSPRHFRPPFKIIIRFVFQLRAQQTNWPAACAVAQIPGPQASQPAGQPASQLASLPARRRTLEAKSNYYYYFAHLFSRLFGARLASQLASQPAAG